MAINLDKPRISRATVRKNIGDSLTAAVINKQTVDRYEYGTNRKMMKDNGKAKQQLVITCLLIDGSKATVGPKDDTRPGNTGEVVNLYLPSWDYGAWIDGTKKHDQLAVGDVFQWTYVRDEKSTGGSDNDRKVTEFKIRHPKPGEEGQTAKCEALHLELKGEPVHGDEPTTDDFEDEAPF